MRCRRHGFYNNRRRIVALPLIVIFSQLLVKTTCLHGTAKN